MFQLGLTGKRKSECLSLSGVRVRTSFMVSLIQECGHMELPDKNVQEAEWELATKWNPVKEKIGEVWLSIVGQ